MLTRTKNRNVSDVTLEEHDDHIENELSYARCLYNKKTTAELQKELMVLFHDAKKVGHVVEVGW